MEAIGGRIPEKAPGKRPHRETNAMHPYSGGGNRWLSPRDKGKFLREKLKSYGEIFFTKIGICQ